MSLTLAPITLPSPAAAMHLPSLPMAALPSVPGMPVHAVAPRVSPLMIADSLITLAEHADRAGFQQTASSLLNLVFTVLDEPRTPN